MPVALMLIGCRRGGSSNALPQPVAPAKAAGQLTTLFSNAQNSGLQRDARTAATALQRNEYITAYKTLRKMESRTGLTSAQGMALHNAMLGLQRQLAEEVVSGDPRAIEAAKQLRSLSP